MSWNVLCNVCEKFACFYPQPKAPRLKDSYSNCKDLLSKDVQLQWELDVKLWDWDWDYVKFKLSGRISEKQWVALGK
jgi:hypothetical protein